MVVYEPLRTIKNKWLTKSWKTTKKKTQITLKASKASKSICNTWIFQYDKKFIKYKKSYKLSKSFKEVLKFLWSIEKRMNYI